MRITLLLGIGIGLYGQGGGLRGTVTDEAGAPLGRAFVTATRLATRVDDAGRTRFAVTTQANGSFEMLGLPAGTYLICGAKEPFEGYVDYCAWTLTPPQINITTTVIEGYRIRLEKGVRVDAVVADPDGVLRGRSEEAKGRQLRITAGGPGVPPNALQFFKSDALQAEYYVIVPKRLKVRVAAAAADADLSRRSEAAALAKKNVDEEIDYVEGQNVRRVEFRYHKRKD